MLDLLDGCDWQRAFYGFVYSGVDMFEGVEIRGQLLLYGPVVDGPQDAQVERAAVLAHAPVVQPGFVHEHQVGVDLIDCHVFVFAEVHETLQGGAVGFGCAVLAPSF